MTGLILEGGTFRGIFSAGVMDAFLREGIEFPYVSGVSAGISNAVSYISKQEGRNLELLVRYRNDDRYLGVKNFAKCGSYFGLDFVYGEIPNKLIPFDYAAFHQYEGTALVGVTNALTGKAEYKNALEDGTDWQFLRASCAIPGYFPAIKLGGIPYYDGGLACPVTYKKALRDGCEKLVIILTRPSGFIRKPSAAGIAMSQAIKAKYPAVEHLLLVRHKLYNAQMKKISELEKSGQAFVIRPDFKLESFEKRPERIIYNYTHGISVAYREMDKLARFLA
ncbi:MAG: patatin family protein [Ruminococcus sp.]|jgi:predicted patatin/cPLA2 family phospholipase|nr:patatin family protein [Ruminococcus sp.]